MNKKLSTKDITYISLLAVLAYISGLIKIPVGAVPITMQTLIVNITGLILSPLQAALAMIIHLFLKIFLADGLSSPSFGFVIGFIIAGYFSSLYFQNSKNSNTDMIISIIIAAITPYIIGLPYMAYVLNSIGAGDYSIAQIFQMGMLIFIPGDTLKAVISYFIGKKLLKNI